MNLADTTIPSLQIPPGKIRHRFKDHKQPGLYLTVGSKTKTWELKRRGRWHRLGGWPAMPCARARRRALEVLAADDEGRVANLTLARAYQLWAKQKKRSPRTEAGAKDMMRLYFSDWENKLITDLSREDVQRRHEHITEKHGPGAANNAMRFFRAWWRAAMRLDQTLPVALTIAVNWNEQPRKDESHLLRNLADWSARLDDVVRNPMRVALYRFALLSGLRANDLRTMRWENVEEDSILLPCPKGGIARAFRLPLLPAHLALLPPRSGEWVWPAVSRQGCIADLSLSIAEAREMGDLYFSPHSLRRVFISAAFEAEVAETQVKLLTNHFVPGVTGRYIARQLNLRRSMDRIVQHLLSAIECGHTR